MKMETKITKYCEKNLNKVSEEIILCCNKQGISLKVKYSFLVIEIVIGLIKEELMNTKKFNKKEMKEITKRINKIERINNIFKIMPNTILDKLEKKEVTENGI